MAGEEKSAGYNSCLFDEYISLTQKCKSVVLNVSLLKPFLFQNLRTLSANYATEAFRSLADEWRRKSQYSYKQGLNSHLTPKMSADYQVMNM